VLVPRLTTEALGHPTGLCCYLWDNDRSIGIFHCLCHCPWANCKSIGTFHCHLSLSQGQLQVHWDVPLPLSLSQVQQQVHWDVPLPVSLSQGQQQVHWDVPLPAVVVPGLITRALGSSTAPGLCPCPTLQSKAEAGLPPNHFYSQAYITQLCAWCITQATSLSNPSSAHAVSIHQTSKPDPFYSHEYITRLCA